MLVPPEPHVATPHDQTFLVTIGTVAVGALILWVVDQVLARYYLYQKRKKKAAATAAAAAPAAATACCWPADAAAADAAAAAAATTAAVAGRRRLLLMAGENVVGAEGVGVVGVAGDVAGTGDGLMAMMDDGC